MPLRARMDAVDATGAIRWSISLPGQCHKLIAGLFIEGLSAHTREGRRRKSRNRVTRSDVGSGVKLSEPGLASSRYDFEQKAWVRVSPPAPGHPRGLRIRTRGRVMALCDIENNDSRPIGLTEEQEARLEAVYLSRRARDSRRHRQRPVTEAEYRAEVGDGHSGQGEPATGVLGSPITPAPKPKVCNAAPRKRNRATNIERELSLEEMARTMTGKRAP